MILGESMQSLLALPNLEEVGVVTIRLVAATVLGGLLGLTREHQRKAAGLRTHMLVALGAATVVLAPRLAGMNSGDVSRVIQGVVTGIGFLGAGTILKTNDEHQIHGLTTAASVWVTAGIGVAAGVAPLWLAVASGAVAWVVLTPLALLERRIEKNR